MMCHEYGLTCLFLIYLTVFGFLNDLFSIPVDCTLRYETNVEKKKRIFIFDVDCVY